MFKRVVTSTSLMTLALVFLVACSENPMQSQFDESPALMKDKVSKKIGSPESGKTIVDIASSSEDFQILTEAVIFAGLADELDGKRQFTVFAPTDMAFQNLVKALTESADLPSEGATIHALVGLGKEAVTSVLLYHVAPGERFSGDVTNSARINTLLKEFILVDGIILNDDVNLLAPDLIDIDASNGIIHAIDAVLLPPSM